MLVCLFCLIQTYTLAPSTSFPGGIKVSGDTPLSITAGIGHYLTHVANASISWTATGGDNIHQALPPSTLPPLPQGGQTVTRTAIGGENSFRYYFNTCTYGYSMVWWDWPRWEQELDWMALHGVNAPLSMLVRVSCFVFRVSCSFLFLLSLE